MKRHSAFFIRQQILCIEEFKLVSNEVGFILRSKNRNAKMHHPDFTNDTQWTPLQEMRGMHTACLPV